MTEKQEFLSGLWVGHVVQGLFWTEDLSSLAAVTAAQKSLCVQGASAAQGSPEEVCWL